RRSSPHYHAAAMDGIAVRAEETVGATETSPVRLRHETQFHRVDTGDPVPLGFNAVVMAEHVHDADGATVELQAPVAPWQHVRPLGEDIVATELVVPENHRLRPVDLGAIAASGVTEVAVRRCPRVAVIPTGSELVPPGGPLKPGDIVEYNSLTLAAMVLEWGGEAKRLPPVPDDLDQLRNAVQKALEEHDVVVINAGSSAGSEDFTAPVVEALGRVAVHGVAIRPGHPVVLGVAGGKPVVGIPGYPVSAILTSELFVKPLVERMLGVVQPRRTVVTATMTRKVLSPMGEDEYLRVKLGKVAERLVATPLQRGAGVIMSLVRADGLVRIPRFSEGVHAGAPVDVELLRSLEEVEHTIVAIGSHDLALDVLASHLRRQDPTASLRTGQTLTLSSSNVGSVGGLLALKRGEAHLAGCHLLDEDTGEYNVSPVRRILEGQRVVLVRLVGRIQGLIIPRDNPRRVRSLEDLARGDVAFINRQRGSGTRVLLDYQLKQMGLAPEGIPGYEREEYTHLAVAAAVASGTADAGLGILAAARALELDFVPLFQEQYDLAIPIEHYEGALLAPLLATVRSEGFRRDVAALGGYDVSRMGEVVAEVG
ncbi:MAG: molybdopterin biosynthesis protein, partial [SAR202 cluster bacterium]|nr:molybdopterin biosynthesis protein [SAR202 cluster bacterium]